MDAQLAFEVFVQPSRDLGGLAMGRLLLQCRDPEARRRVDQDYHLPILHDWCASVAELTAGSRLLDVLGLVVDTSDQDGRPNAPVVYHIRRDYAKLPILVWCRRQDTASGDFQELCRVGATRRGDVLAFIHARTEADAERAREALDEAIVIGESAKRLPLVSHRVTAAGVEAL